jgi:hypothetical protein
MKKEAYYGHRLMWSWRMLFSWLCGQTDQMTKSQISFNILLFIEKIVKENRNDER